jgi:putative endonuclease
MYTVYILKSESAQKSYVGFTDNLKRRIKEHNSGKSIYTKRYMPWEVLYSKKYNTLLEARDQEKYFKSAAGRKFLKKLFNNEK